MRSTTRWICGAAPPSGISRPNRRSDPEAAQLDDLRLAAIEERIEAQLEIGELGEVIGELEGLTARHPLRERFWEQLMLALYRTGRQGEALGAYQRAREDPRR